MLTFCRSPINQMPMNIYGLIILTALLAGFVLEAVADRLNLKALDPALPDEFAGVYDAEKYARSQEYTRVRSRFGLVTGVFDLAVLLLFWQLGGFNYLDQLVRVWQYGTVINGLIFTGILLLARTIISLPSLTRPIRARAAPTCWPSRRICSASIPCRRKAGSTTWPGTCPPVLPPGPGKR